MAQTGSISLNFAPQPSCWLLPSTSLGTKDKHFSEFISTIFPSIHSCGFAPLRGLSKWNGNWRSNSEGREIDEADHSGEVGGSFNNGGNLHMRLVCDRCDTSRSPRPTARILKVYIKALTGFSHRYSPDSLRNTLLCQGCVLEYGSGYGSGRRNPLSEDGEGLRSLQLLQVQLWGQLAVMSSWWPPPIIARSKSTHIYLVECLFYNFSSLNFKDIKATFLS